MNQWKIPHCILKDKIPLVRYQTRMGKSGKDKWREREINEQKKRKERGMARSKEKERINSQQIMKIQKKRIRGGR